MAKGYALSGNIKGKKGSSVFYGLKNSNNKVTQGVREYKGEVKNPKTQAQAAQRMRLTPAVNFYRGLREILDHSFEGVKYGARSYAKFMKMALDPDNEANYPYVPKGVVDFIPGEYVISDGSLRPVTIIKAGGDGGVANTQGLQANVTLTADESSGISWNDYVRNSIDSGVINYGDQLTAIFICDMGNGKFMPIVRRLVFVNDDSVTNVATKLLEAGFVVVDSFLRLVTAYTAEDGFTDAPYSLVGGAVIISRPVTTGGTVKWKRSRAKLFLNDAFKAQYMSQAMFNQALASYLPGAVEAQSDWYLNQGQLAATEVDEIPEDAEVVITDYDMMRYSSMLPYDSSYYGIASRFTCAALGLDGIAGEIQYLDENNNAVDPNSATRFRLRYWAPQSQDDTEGAYGDITSNATTYEAFLAGLKVDIIPIQRAQKLVRQLGVSQFNRVREGTSWQ